MSSKKPTHVQESPAYIFLGVKMSIHLSGVQTGGAFSLIEATMPPGGDGGLHVHTQEDESIHLLGRTLHVTIGDDSFTLEAGQSYFAPRTISHQLRNRGDVPARALLITTPGNFDEFVCRAGIPIGQQSPLPSVPGDAYVQQLPALAEEFGIKILAAPEQPARI